MVKKDGVNFYKQPHLYTMLPPFYQNCFQKQLKKAEYLTLQILVFLLQTHKQVSIESLATVMPYPTTFESRRCAIQRFLKLPTLNIEKLWLPLIKYILRTQFNKQKELIVAIDRTQWRDRNIFFICLIWQQRALPLYWQILPKKGCSNIREQKQLIIPIFPLLTKYKFALIGDREFGSVKLAKGLGEKNVRFVLRIQNGRYIEEEGEKFKRLSDLGLMHYSQVKLKALLSMSKITHILPVDPIKI